MSDRETLHTVLDVLAAKEADARAVVAWEHRGEHDARSVYRRGDVVRFARATYVSVSDTPGECPGEGWQLVAGVGPQGPQGPQGLPGATGKLGQIGPPGKIGPPGRSIRWRGKYAPFTRYQTDDVVHYDNALWIALRPTEASPKADQVNWDLVIRFFVPNLDKALHRIDDMEALLEDLTERVIALEQWDVDHIAADDPHPQYLLPEELPQTAVAYLSAAANPEDPTKYTFTPVKPTTAEAAITTPVNADDVLCAAFLREPAFASDLLYAEVETRVVLDLAGEPAATFVYVEAWLIKGDTSPSIQLGVSGAHLLQEQRGLYVFIVQILGPITAVAGDRTEIRIYGTKDGGGASRTVTVFVDGNAVSRALTYLPIPAYPAAHAPSHETGGSDEIQQLTDTTNLLAGHIHDGTDGTVKVAHTDLAGRYTADQHRISNITDLEDELTAKVYAAYIAMRAPNDQAVPDLGAAWYDLDGLTPGTLTPLHFTDGGNGQFVPEWTGVYFLSVAGAFEHNSLNGARNTYIRAYNHTDGVAGNDFIIPTGRNAEATSINVGTLLVVAAADIGKSFGFQVGGGDTYTSVIVNALGYSIFNVGIIST